MKEGARAGNRAARVTESSKEEDAGDLSEDAASNGEIGPNAERVWVQEEQ